MNRFSGELDILNPTQMARMSGGMGSSNNQIQRHGGNLTLTSPFTTGMWNNTLTPAAANPLFDLQVPDALIGLAWFDEMHPVFNILGWQNTDEIRKEQGYITYIAASGAGAGSPSSGIITDPCAAGNPTEFGSAVQRIEGFSRFRRSSQVIDITALGLKKYARQQIHLIDGTRVTDDYLWAILQLTHVQLQDIHTWLIDGDGSNSGETDGLWNLMDGTAIDAVTGNNIPALANFVIDWNSGTVNSAGGSAAISAPISTSITSGENLWRIFREWIQLTRTRLRWSTLAVNRGFEVHVLTDPMMLPCLIEAWICDTICGGDPTSESQRQLLDTMEAREMRDRMRAFLQTGAVPFNIDGVRFWFHGYEWGTSLNNGDGTYNMLGFINNVGGQKTFMLEANDLNRGLNLADLQGATAYQTSDNGRFLSMESLDLTCVQYHTEIQPRLGIFNKWLGFKISNVSCGSYMPFHADPSNSIFLGIGAVDSVEYQTHPDSPTLNAAFTQTEDGLEVTFNSSTSTGYNLSYLWNFGDGNTSTEANPVHTYAGADTYTVTLHVSNEDGIDSASDDVTVS